MEHAFFELKNVHMSVVLWGIMVMCIDILRSQLPVRDVMLSWRTRTLGRVSFIETREPWFWRICLTGRAWLMDAD